MSKQAQRRRRRPGRPQLQQRGGGVSRAGAVDSFHGVPVFEGLTVEVVHGYRGPEIIDAHLLIGIGAAGEVPSAFVTLCPCDGVRGVITELEQAAAVAAEYHGAHSPLDGLP